MVFPGHNEIVTQGNESGKKQQTKQNKNPTGTKQRFSHQHSQIFSSSFIFKDAM